MIDIALSWIDFSRPAQIFGISFAIILRNDLEVRSP